MLGQQDVDVSRKEDHFRTQNLAQSDISSMFSMMPNVSQDLGSHSAYGSNQDSFGGPGLGAGNAANGSSANGDGAAAANALHQLAAMMPGMTPQQLQAIYQEAAMRQLVAFGALAPSQGVNPALAAMLSGANGTGFNMSSMPMSTQNGLNGGPGMGGMGPGMGDPQARGVDANKAMFQKGRGGSNTERHAFYKTRICSKWREGSCAYGNTCHYAHGTHELRMPGSSGRPANGAPMDKRMLINMMKKTRLCQDFVNSGRCRYGEKCTFAHGQHELREPPDLRSMMNQSMRGEQGAQMNGNGMGGGSLMDMGLQMNVGAPQMNGSGIHMNEGSNTLGGPSMNGSSQLSKAAGAIGMAGADASYQHGLSQGWPSQSLGMMNLPTQPQNFN